VRKNIAIALLCCCAMSTGARAQDTSLVGLWASKRYFGPEVRGKLELIRTGDRWQVSIGGRSADVRVSRDTVSFSLPSEANFVGRFAGDRRSIVGQWIEPQRRIASPLVLAACGAGCYATTIEPIENEFAFYMDVKRRADGRLSAFLRNPDRNQGFFIGLSHLTRNGDTVFFRNARDTVLEKGLLRQGMLSVLLRFATHDFRKVHPDSFTNFYPRGRPTGAYTYTPPRQRSDGWSVARAQDVGLSEQKLSEMIQRFVNASADSSNMYRPHGILIARHGKLVLEEYFHGEHADKPHDTRSASKTLITVVLGAAMHAGMNVSPATPVYATMGMASSTLDPRKRAMQLRHLLTMSSGLDCDDAVRDSPGAENVVTGQGTNPDWNGLVLGLNMVRDPGALAVYCSINPMVAGEVIERATGRGFTDLMWELVGGPMQFGRHALVLTPLGDSYMGGGARLLPRDFLKVAQLYANGGTWNGRRILTDAWVRESVQPRYRIGRTFRQGPTGPTETNDNNYGYLWWTTEFEHQGRRVLAHHASGNGGQYSMFFPELGLTVVTYGGNYNDSGGFYTLRNLVPREILPAIIESGSR
jgi:CubicO group peptidase (beta-lactamase class C family)